MSEQKAPLTWKDYLSVGFSCFSLFALSSFTALFQINEYYFKNTSNNFSISTYSTVFNTTLLLIALSDSLKIISVFLMKFLTIKNIIFSCLSTAILANVLLLFFPYYSYVLFSMVIYSLAYAASFFPVLVSTWKLFNIEKTLSCSLVIFSHTLGRAVFASIFELTSHRPFIYGIIVISVLASALVGDIFFIQNYDEKEKFKGQIKMEHNLDLNRSINDVDEYDEENEKSDDEESSRIFSAIKEAVRYIKKILAEIFTKKFFNLSLSYSLLLSGIYVISTSYISFAISNKISLEHSKGISFVYIFLSPLSVIVWGLLKDKKGFRVKILFVFSFHILAVSLFPLVLVLPSTTYVIGLINAICMAGINAMFIPMTYKEFSSESKYYLEDIGFLFLIGGGIQYIIPIILKETCWFSAGFLLAFVISVLMCLSSFLLVKYLIYPDVVDENEKQEWDEQDKMRELRKE